MLVDLLHLARTLRRSPASGIAAIATLSLTLGAGASIYAVVDAVLLTPPPFANPEALVTVGEQPIDQPSAAPRAVVYATYEGWRQRASDLATLEALDGTNFTLTGLGAAERVSAAYVTPGYLTLLGIAPALGRGFAVDDIGRPVVVISHEFWRGRLGGDRDVIGRQIVLGSRPHTIVGVLPERIVFALNANDFWLPFTMSPSRAAATGQRVAVMARLGTGVTPGFLAAALDQVSRTSSPPARVIATPVATAIAGDATRTLGLLAGAAALAMLIAFANLAGLLIVRSIDRRRELAVRSALGARRVEIARQVLLEALALVAVGTVGGVVLATWMTPAVASVVLEQFGGLARREVTVSWRVILILSALASTCAVICGWGPALAAARRSVADSLRREATRRPHELRFRRALVSGQVAVAFVLLVSMTLLGRSLARMLEINPGFDARGVLALSVSVPIATYPTERVVSFYSALQSGLDGRFGPRSVSIVDELPLTGDRGRILVSAGPADSGREVVVRSVSRYYFEVMRIPVVAGRSFDARDGADAGPRVILSQSLARALFGSQEPIGRSVRFASAGQLAEVIGVAGDVKHRALDDPPLPTVYLPMSQSPSRSSRIVVRSARPDADVIALVREEVARLDRDQPVYGTQSMQNVVASSPGVPARRVLTATFMGFALLALVLGTIGLFGVVAHDVASRRTELALRIALGADPARLVTRTLSQGATMVGFGLIAGGVLSMWAARALGSVLPAADRLDIVSITVPAAVLLAAGIGAVWPAARRAARTDPLIVLRSE
jgi:putative ABC transport system permease protein